jgi:hypothetical protein
VVARLDDLGADGAPLLSLGRRRQLVEASTSALPVRPSLYMSVATVKAHVSRLLTKLELNNRVQVAQLAHDAGVA